MQKNPQLQNAVFFLVSVKSIISWNYTDSARQCRYPFHLSNMSHVIVLLPQGSTSVGHTRDGTVQRKKSEFSPKNCYLNHLKPQRSSKNPRFSPNQTINFPSCPNFLAFPLFFLFDHHGRRGTGLRATWFLAASPMRRSVSVKATLARPKRRTQNVRSGTRVPNAGGGLVVLWIPEASQSFFCSLQKRSAVSHRIFQQCFKIFLDLCY